MLAAIAAQHALGYEQAWRGTGEAERFERVVDDVSGAEGLALDDDRIARSGTVEQPRLLGECIPFVLLNCRGIRTIVVTQHYVVAAPILFVEIKRAVDPACFRVDSSCQMRFDAAPTQLPDQPLVFVLEPIGGIVVRFAVELDGDVRSAQRRGFQGRDDRARQRVRLERNLIGAADRREHSTGRAQLEHRACHHDRRSGRLVFGRHSGECATSFWKQANQP